MEAKTALEQKPPQMAVSPAVTPGTPGLKRSRQPVVSDYNTRHRDKRARVSDPGPGSRRKAGRKPNGPIEAAVYSPKQPKSKAALMTGPAIKGRRTIFDGVVLPRFVPSAEKGKDKTDVVVSNGVPPAEQGEENGAADQPLEGLEDLRVESSLASSNKGTLCTLLINVLLISCSENEHESPSQASVNEAGVTPGMTRRASSFSNNTDILLGDATGSPLSQRGRYIPATIRERLLMSFSSRKYSGSSGPCGG